MKMIKLNDTQLSSISAACHRSPHRGGGSGYNGLIHQLKGLLKNLRGNSTINLNLNISVIVISNSQISGNLNISTGQGIFI